MSDEENIIGQVLCTKDRFDLHNQCTDHFNSKQQLLE